MTIPEVAGLASRIAHSIERVIEGKRDAVVTALATLLAEGHLLIEDVPGVGKTMLARALARSVDGAVNRVQFTPDLMPSDVIGVAVFDQVERRFEFQPGAVFANVVIADEINRASPKTQSALLEAMEERQVSVDGHTHDLLDPFIVVATQNPIEMEGTYALPEAQRDRFMARIEMGYPSGESEVDMLDRRDLAEPLETIEPVVTVHVLRDMIDTVRTVFVSPAVKEYAVALATATRHHRDLRLGASPRATLQLVRAAKARAALASRSYVLPDDLAALAVPVLSHRLIPTSRALGRQRDGARLLEEIVRSIVATVPAPRAD
ncbi:MAG: AAA family ATPase [Microbacteriaceae bacterium]|nr:AAA family ATPase [Microbacteriaceae bacterium]